MYLYYIIKPILCGYFIYIWSLNNVPIDLSHIKLYVIPSFSGPGVVCSPQLLRYIYLPQLEHHQEKNSTGSDHAQHNIDQFSWEEKISKSLDADVDEGGRRPQPLSIESQPIKEYGELEKWSSQRKNTLISYPIPNAQSWKHTYRLRCLY